MKYMKINYLTDRGVDRGPTEVAEVDASLASGRPLLEPRPLNALFSNGPR